jgi:cyclic-di-AMP phosphodiesterase PgpH
MTKQPVIKLFNISNKDPVRLKKISFGDDFKRFSQWLEVYTCLYHKKYLKWAGFTGLIAATLLICAILRLILIIPFFLFALNLTLIACHKNIPQKKNQLLYISLLLVVILSVSDSIIQGGWPSYYVPFTAIPMLVTVLFSELLVSLFITLAAAVIISAVAGSSFPLFILIFTSGLAAILLSRQVSRRMQIIRAGVLVGFIQMAALYLINRFSLARAENYLVLFLNGLGSSFIVLGILPIFEYLFKTSTNISLLELADFNQPLLQQLIKDAPGTFHHSLVVGNLSDAASKEVGAHALLARVGAYYHDIGKLTKPEYLSENQANRENIHDDLSPTMSKIVIMNHVKEGIELAKKYNLGLALEDFIQQHHGNSLVYYFYLRALEGLEEEKDVQEEGFRYPGPRPNTKETAIVMLADSCEAATRSLKNHQPAKIEELVHKIINNKFIDGQLDECNLTLKDLEKIAAVFIHILSGIYHSRVIYPQENRP